MTTSTSDTYSFRLAGIPITTADDALEHLISLATDLLVSVQDPLLVEAQRALIALRSPERVRHMEQEQGLG